MKKPWGSWASNRQIMKVYEAFNTLGFSVGTFKMVADGRDFTPEELNEEAERALHCEVIDHCSLIDVLDIWGRSMKNPDRSKLRQGANKANWGYEND